MARVGSLSDMAVKYRYPEWYPLDVGSQGDMHPVHLQKNLFKGIKQPKKTKRFTTVSRFPVNDLKNFAQFGATGRSQEAEFYSIMNYRKELGSNNVMPHLETAYKNRISTDYIPPPMFVPDKEAGGQQVAPTLSLGRFYRKEGQDIFSQNIPGSRSFISARMRATMANLVEPSELQNLTRLVAPGGFRNKISDEEALSILNTEYRNEPEQLQNIERAYHASGKQNMLPIQTSSYEPYNEE